jgi:hypothetical protein
MHEPSRLWGFDGYVTWECAEGALALIIHGAQKIPHIQPRKSVGGCTIDDSYAYTVPKPVRLEENITEND